MLDTALKMTVKMSGTCCARSLAGKRPQNPLLTLANLPSDRLPFLLDAGLVQKVLDFHIKCKETLARKLVRVSPCLVFDT